MIGAVSNSRLLCALAVFLFTFFSVDALAPAQENATGKQLMFIPPPVDGVISLGVYDAHGRLVRVLKQAAEIDSFKAGLDGLFVDWDGTDAKGASTPPGKYFARGVLIGDVTISGVAYHLNDWVDDSHNLRVKTISSPALLNNRSLAVLADTGASEILIIDTPSMTPRRFPVEPGAVRLKSDGAALLAIYSDHIATIALADGTVTEKHPLPNIRDADSIGTNCAILTDRELHYSNGQQEITLELPSPDINRCALLTDSVVVASSNGRLWRSQSGNLVPLNLDEAGQVLDLSAGPANQIWLLVSAGSKSVLRQIDLDSKTSKDLDPAGLQNLESISISRNNGDLVLGEDMKPGRRVIGLHFRSTQDQQSVWEKWFDRSIVPFQFFDVKAGTVIPADAKTDSPPAMIRPANNPLENTRQVNFLLTAVPDDTGAHLATNDGLPLIQISKTKGIQQAKWESNGANGMKVYLSDGTVVEEYNITGLENLYRFNAGSFD
jgi:hypothetical protein